jgi:hypothetical protein
MHVLASRNLEQSMVSLGMLRLQPTERREEPATHERCHYCSDCLDIAIYTRLTPTNSIPTLIYWCSKMPSPHDSSHCQVTREHTSQSCLTSTVKAGLRRSHGESSALSCVFHRVYMPPPFLESIFFLQSNSTHPFNCSYEYNSFAGHTS